MVFFQFLTNLAIIEFELEYDTFSVQRYQSSTETPAKSDRSVSELFQTSRNTKGYTDRTMNSKILQKDTSFGIGKSVYVKTLHGNRSHVESRIEVTPINIFVVVVFLFYLEIFLPKKHLHDSTHSVVHSGMMKAYSSPQRALEQTSTVNFTNAIHDLLQTLQKKNFNKQRFSYTETSKK